MGKKGLRLGRFWKCRALKGLERWGFRKEEVERECRHSVFFSRGYSTYFPYTRVVHAKEQIAFPVILGFTSKIMGGRWRIQVVALLRLHPMWSQAPFEQLCITVHADRDRRRTSTLLLCRRDYCRSPTLVYGQGLGM